MRRERKRKDEAGACGNWVLSLRAFMGLEVGERERKSEWKWRRFLRRGSEVEEEEVAAIETLMGTPERDDFE